MFRLENKICSGADRAAARDSQWFLLARSGKMPTISGVTETSLYRGGRKVCPMVANRDEIMIMDELAEYLKVSKSALRKLGCANRLPGQKIGKRWRFHKDAVGHYGTGSLELTIRRLDGLKKAKPLIQRKFGEN